MWVKVRDRFVNLDHIWKIVVSGGRYMAFYPANPAFKPLVVEVDGNAGSCDISVTKEELDQAVLELLSIGVVDLLGGEG